MFIGLFKACLKESNGLAFKRKDLEGAFGPLYKNRLIDVKIIKENYDRKMVWYVTDLGSQVLLACGVRIVE